MLNKQIPFFVLIFFATLSCQTSIPITIHGVTPEEYFQGKKNLDSAYVAENYPLYQRWYLVGYSDPPLEVVNGIPVSSYALTFTLTNKVDSIKPQYLNYRFLYGGSNSSYRFSGVYEFDLDGNIYFSGIKYKSYYSTFHRQGNGPNENQEWLWDLIITTDKYAVDGEYLTLYNQQDVFVFSKIKPRGSKSRNAYRSLSVRK